MVSLTLGGTRMGMNAQAAEAMRASMLAHRRVHRLFIERAGLRIETFEKLFDAGERPLRLNWSIDGCGCILSHNIWRDSGPLRL